MQVHHLDRLQFFVRSIACGAIEPFYSPAMINNKDRTIMLIGGEQVKVAHR
jgi:hypothetical protein